MLDVVTSSSISPEIRKPHRVRRQFLRDGRRGAVIRALTAASIERTAYPLLPGVEAHEATGSNRRYLWAATILLKAEDPTLIQAVLPRRPHRRGQAIAARCQRGRCNPQSISGRSRVRRPHARC